MRFLNFYQNKKRFRPDPNPKINKGNQGLQNLLQAEKSKLLSTPFSWYIGLSIILYFYIFFATLSFRKRKCEIMYGCPTRTDKSFAREGV